MCRVTRYLKIYISYAQLYHDTSVSHIVITIGCIAIVIQDIHSYSYIARVQFR